MKAHIFYFLRSFHCSTFSDLIGQCVIKTASWCAMLLGIFRISLKKSCFCPVNSAELIFSYCVEILRRRGVLKAKIYFLKAKCASKMILIFMG